MHINVSSATFEFQISVFKLYKKPFQTNEMSMKLKQIKAGWSIVYIEG